VSRSDAHHAPISSLKFEVWGGGATKACKRY